MTKVWIKEQKRKEKTNQLLDNQAKENKGSYQKVYLFPEEFFCSDITVEEDKFDNKITYRTPASNGIVIIKVIDGENKTTYLSLTTSGSTVNVGEKGVTILMEDDTKLVFPEIVVKPKATRNGYAYNAFIPLKETDLAVLESKMITDFRLYIYDAEIDIEYANKVKEYINCLKSK